MLEELSWTCLYCGKKARTTTVKGFLSHQKNCYIKLFYKRFVGEVACYMRENKNN